MTQENCVVTYKVATPENSSTLELTMLPIYGGQVILGDGLKERDSLMPVFIARSRSKSADFVSVIRIGNQQGLAVKRLADLPEGIVGIEIDKGDGVKDYLLSVETPRKITFAGKDLEGQLAFIRVQSDGTVTQLEVAK